MNDRSTIVRPPRSGEIQVISLSTTGACTALITTLAGLGWLRVKVLTANAKFFFTTNASAAVVYAATTGVDNGWPLLAGQTEDYELTNETHIAWDADGTGELHIMRAGAKGKPR